MPRKPTRRRRTVSAKRALAEALRELGLEASSSSLVEFARKQFGIKFQFMMMLPKQKKNRIVRLG
jgi:hypothetical protein